MRRALHAGVLLLALPVAALSGTLKKQTDVALEAGVAASAPAETAALPAVGELREASSTRSGVTGASGGATDVEPPRAPAAYGALATALSLAALLGAVCFASQFPDVKLRTEPRDPLSARVLRATDVVIAAAAVVVDSTVGSVVVPLLPGLSGGRGIVALYFAGPVVGVSTALLMPLVLRDGAHRGRLVASLGLVLLSMACQMYGQSSDFSSALMARLTSAAASGMIVAPVLHTLTLQGPADQVGWGLDAAIYAIITGTVCGPWLGSRVTHIDSVPDSLGALSVFAALAACAHLCVSWPASHGAYATHEAGARALGGSVFSAVRGLFGDVRQCLLLLGVGTCAAVLSLHGALVPLRLMYLTQATGASELADAEGLAGLSLGVVVLGCGLLTDRFGDHAAARVMVVALVLSATGLRTIEQGLSGSYPVITSLGLFASHCGLGAFLGLAPPLVFRFAKGALPLTPAPVAAVTSSGLAIAWIIGDAIGVGLQLVLYPKFGYKQTIMFFAACLTLQAALVFALLGWMPDGPPQPSKRVGSIIERAK